MLNRGRGKCDDIRMFLYFVNWVKENNYEFKSKLNEWMKKRFFMINIGGLKFWGFVLSGWVLYWFRFYGCKFGIDGFVIGLSFGVFLWLFYLLFWFILIIDWSNVGVIFGEVVLGVELSIVVVVVDVGDCWFRFGVEV